MTTTVKPTAPPNVSATLPRHRFTVDEYLRMGEVGILHEDDRVELIEGEIIEMAPIGSGHAARVDEIAALLTRATGPGIKISVQNPLHLGQHSAPQPDLMILPQRPDRYVGALPTAVDVLCLIEVSESTLAYDRGDKLLLYARAAVAEVWIVDPVGPQVEIYTNPANGAYQTRRVAGRGETITPTRLPDLTVKTDNLLL
jgi:Uma2 family endonuclease